jgi:hypothetical protein
MLSPLAWLAPLQRYDCADARATRCRSLDAAAAAELRGALAHRGEAHASARLWRDTASVIRDLDQQVARAVDRKADDTPVRGRVANDVCHRLDRDPIRGDLNSSGERRQIMSLHADPEAPRVLVLRGSRAECGHETELVERGRTQVSHQPSDLRDRVARAVGEIAEERSGLGLARETVARGLKT